MYVSPSQVLQQHVEESQATVRSLETKVDDATKSVKQLESSMAVCKEEIGLYMDQMGDMKERHEAEINEKVDAVRVDSCNLCGAVIFSGFQA